MLLFWTVIREYWKNATFSIKILSSNLINELTIRKELDWQAFWPIITPNLPSCHLADKSNRRVNFKLQQIKSIQQFKLRCENFGLNESFEWVIQWLAHTCFIPVWTNVFEWIIWVSDSMTRSYMFSSCMNQCVWMNRLSEWFNDSLIHVFFLYEPMCLNESFEWVIQWLAHKCFIPIWTSVFEWIIWVSDSMTRSYMFYSYMNQCVWMNRLSEWFNDSLIHVFFLYETVCLNESFEWVIQWLAHTCFLPYEPMCLNESFEWVIQWLAHTCFLPVWTSVFEWIVWVSDSMTRSYMFSSCMKQCVWMNRLSEWFNDSLIHVLFLYEPMCLNESFEWVIQWLAHTCFIPVWTSVFEWIVWVSDSMTRSYMFYSCMNRCVWMNRLSEWFNDSLIHVLFLYEPVCLNESVIEWLNKSFIKTPPTGLTNIYK